MHGGTVFKKSSCELVQDSKQHELRFLPLGQEAAEIVLGLGEIAFFLGAGLAKGVELALDLVGSRAVVVQGGAQIIDSSLDGRRRLSAGVGVLSAAATTTAGTSSEHSAAAEAAAINVHAKLEHGLNFGLQYGKLIVRSAQRLLKALQHSLPRLSGIEASSATTAPAAVEATATTPACSTSSASPAAGVVVIVLPAASAAVIRLAKDRQGEQADHRYRDQPTDSAA
jgi:hypothetical protein